MINETKMIIPKKYQGAIKKIYKASNGHTVVILNDGHRFAKGSKTIGCTTQKHALELIRTAIIDWPEDPAIAPALIDGYGIENEVPQDAAGQTVDGFHRISVREAMTRYQDRIVKPMDSCKRIDRIPFDFLNDIAESNTLDTCAFKIHFSHTTMTILGGMPQVLTNWHCVINEKTNVIVFYMVHCFNAIELQAFYLCPSDDNK